VPLSEEVAGELGDLVPERLRPGVAVGLRARDERRLERPGVDALAGAVGAVIISRAASLLSDVLIWGVVHALSSGERSAGPSS
jgi:hypothetical protein